MTAIEKLTMLRDVALNTVPDRDVTSADVHAYASRLLVAAQLEIAIVERERWEEEKRSRAARQGEWLKKHGLEDLMDPAPNVITDCERAVDQANKNASQQPAPASGTQG